MFKKFIVAWWMSLFAIAGVSPIAHGQSGSVLPSDSLVREILTWLSANFDLPKTSTVPSIKFLSKEQLAKMRYGNEGDTAGSVSDHSFAAAGTTRDVVSLYDTTNETIYLRMGWTGANPAEQSVLVHELVHHLQKTGGLTFECPMAREKTAYIAQDRWLERFGTSIEKEFEIDKFTVVISSACFL
jgi:hypothetical protein